MTGLPIYRKGFRLLMVALLFAVQLLYAGSVTANQPSTSTQTLSETEFGAENGKSQLPPAAEIAPISVPVSDAVKQAALLMRPTGATLDQVVAAMVMLNPAEFEHGDLRHVIFSRPLNVPSTQEILREDPGGLALLLLQLDIVTAASSRTGSNQSAARRQVEDRQQQFAPTLENMTLAAMTEPQISVAEEPSIAGSIVWIVVSAALLLISLLWLWLRLLPSSKLASRDEGRKESRVMQLVQDDQHMLQTYDLPDEYLNYDDVEVLLSRLVGDFPDASRHVLQLMHFYRMRVDREGFQRQYQILLESGFFQRHAEIRSVVTLDAAKLGLELNEATAVNVSTASEERIQQLKERVVKAEKATRSAEKRAGKAELEIRKMQLQLDFGETKNE